MLTGILLREWSPIVGDSSILQRDLARLVDVAISSTLGKCVGLNPALQRLILLDLQPLHAPLH